MTPRRHIPRAAAANPRTPYNFLRNSRRSDRSEIAGHGPKVSIWGSGENSYKQLLRSLFRPERPERPEFQGNARAYCEPGFGVKYKFHALPCTSGRSSRSSRDPPIIGLFLGA